MPAHTDQALAALHRLVIDSPELQARLFAIADLESFVTVVRQLAFAAGDDLQDDELRQALYAGYRGWRDRRVP